MNLLILGDIMGASGRKALSKKLPELINKNKIEFREDLSNEDEKYKRNKI